MFVHLQILFCLQTVKEVGHYHVHKNQCLKQWNPSLELSLIDSLKLSASFARKMQVSMFILVPVIRANKITEIIHNSKSKWKAQLADVSNIVYHHLCYTQRLLRMTVAGSWLDMLTSQELLTCNLFLSSQYINPLWICRLLRSTILTRVTVCQSSMHLLMNGIH